MKPSLFANKFKLPTRRTDRHFTFVTHNELLTYTPFSCYNGELYNFVSYRTGLPPFSFNLEWEGKVLNRFDNYLKHNLSKLPYVFVVQKAIPKRMHELQGNITSEEIEEVAANPRNEGPQDAWYWNQPRNIALTRLIEYIYYRTNDAVISNIIEYMNAWDRAYCIRVLARLQSASRLSAW